MTKVSDIIKLELFAPTLVIHRNKLPFVTLDSAISAGWWRRCCYSSAREPTVRNQSVEPTCVFKPGASQSVVFHRIQRQAAFGVKVNFQLLRQHLLLAAVSVAPVWTTKFPLCRQPVQKEVYITPPNQLVRLGREWRWKLCTHFTEKGVQKTVQPLLCVLLKINPNEARGVSLLEVDDDDDDDD